MREEFSRTERLLGAERLETLRQASVMVLGVGGVGSHCIEALARSGVGRLILVDGDQVTLSNINRQSIALHSTVGRDKTEVMKEKIRDICPGIQVECRQIFILPENVDDLFDQKLDYIVDAIDTVSAKIAVAGKALAYGVPIISSMGTGNKLHGELFEIADLSETSVCPLCRVMRRELKKRGIEHLKVLYSKEPPIRPVGNRKQEEEQEREEKREPEKEGRRPRAVPGSVSFVPPVAGLLIAGEVIRDLIESGKERDNGSAVGRRGGLEDGGDAHGLV